MKLAVTKERRAHETRVAATPETVKKYIGQGFSVCVEQGAGVLSNYMDEDYLAAGASIVADAETLLADADIVVKVQRPLLASEGGMDELSLFKPGSILLSILSPYNSEESLSAYAQANVVAIALEFVPRISRAQSMDVLSSQSNLAGYRAVLDAAYEYGKAFPMMMTAAGTVAPAKVMVLGAGVAGLQAIATAKRLGAIVSATDVRAAAKEQVESLGGKFVMVDSDEMKNAETAGGYAKEMSDDFKKKQAQLVAQTIEKQDIVICTALIPGRKAPQLVSEEMVRSMRTGSVIIDLAVEQGGNCAFAKLGEVVNVDGVSIVGHHNFPGRVATDASALYGKNIFNLIALMVAEDESGNKSISVPWDDEIITASTLTREGKVIHPSFIEFQ